MSNIPAIKRSQTDFSLSTSSPLRHGSSASTNSSAYSIYSNPFAPSRTSTLSSNSSGFSLSDIADRKGGLDARADDRYGVSGPLSASETYGDVRRSLRPLGQAPNSSPPLTKTMPSHHIRSQTVDHSNSQHPLPTTQTASIA